MPKPAKLKIDCDDLYSKHGARLLADAIVNYWLNKGHLVFAEGYQLAAGCWGVRSNLVNGLPPKHLALRT